MNDPLANVETAQSDILRLLEIMAQLRDPDKGCPWDRQQSFATIAPYTIEEAYEVADAIERGDPDALLDELGDLLFQIVFHAQMAAENGTFNFDDVARTISDKMIRRHPHVFADPEDLESEFQHQSWETLKAAEREARAADNDQSGSALEGVADALPALMRSEKLQNRAARVGFDWPDIAPVFDKIDEEIEEIHAALAEVATKSKIKEEVGDLLFTVVNLARHLEIDAEDALRGANKKFDRRFRAIESRLAAEGKTPTDANPEELERHWLVVKNQESGAS